MSTKCKICSLSDHILEPINEMLLAGLPEPEIKNFAIERGEELTKHQIENHRRNHIYREPVTDDDLLDLTGVLSNPKLSSYELLLKIISFKALQIERLETASRKYFSTRTERLLTEATTQLAGILQNIDYE